MPDIFLSYNREDQAAARRYAKAFEAAGFEVWWDSTLRAGEEYDLVTENALKAARAVVVLWSPRSVVSRWVRAEATLASRSRTLVPVMIEPCERPVMFELHQTADLSHWNGSTRDSAWQAFLADLRRFIADGNSVGEDAPAALALANPITKSWWLGGSKLSRIGASVIAVAIVVGLAAYFLLARPGAAIVQGRVAILPFEATNDTELTRATAKALTAQLGDTLNSGEIPTVSDADAASLRGPDAAARLKLLGVTLLLGGSVEADDKNVDIKIHLDDPAYHVTLWTGGVSGPVANMVALRAQAANIGANLLACSNRALKPGGLSDPTLLTHYLAACDLFANHDDATGATNTFELIRDLHAVIDGAPGFVPARTDLAKFSAYLAPTMPPSAASKMRAEAAREAEAALKLQPKSPDAWLAKAMLLPPTDWAGREALLRKGQAIDPDWPHTNGFLAQLLQETGRMREAEDYAGRAAAAQLQIDWRPWGGSFACDARDFEPATTNLRALSAEHPVGFAGIALFSCLADAGRYKEAAAMLPPVANGDEGLTALILTYKALASGKSGDREAARQAALKLGSGTMPQISNAVGYLGMLGEFDDAFRLGGQLEAGHPRTGDTVAFLFSPPLEGMRRDPRFMHLAARLKLAQFWLVSGKWPDFCSEPGLPYDCKTEAVKVTRGTAT